MKKFKIKEEDLIELTKVSAELSVRLLLDEISVLEQKGIILTNKMWLAKRDSNTREATEIVLSTYDILANKLSDKN